MSRVVAILLPRWSRSGGVRALVELANGLHAQGDEVSFLVLDADCRCPFPLHEEIRIRSLICDGLPTSARRLATRLLAPMRVPPCDSLIFSDCPSAYLARIAQRLGRVRQPVFYVQSYDPLHFGERHLARGRSVRRALAAAAYDLPLTYVGCSGFMRDLLFSAHGQAAEVVNPGVNTTIFRPCRVRPPGDFVITTVGRSLAAKGLAEFAEAARIVRQAEPRCRVCVITADPLDNPDPTWWEIVRPQDDHALAQVYADSDLFVVSSFLESFMLSALEAMACGVPTISTDNRGIREYANDGDNCVIVSRPTPDRLAEGMLRIARNPEFRQRLVAGGLDTARRFPWRNLVEGFDRVLSRHP